MPPPEKQQIVNDIRRTLLIALADLGALAPTLELETNSDQSGDSITVQIEARISVALYLKMQQPMEALADSLKFPEHGVYS